MTTGIDCSNTPPPPPNLKWMDEMNGWIFKGFTTIYKNAFLKCSGFLDDKASVILRKWVKHIKTASCFGQSKAG